MHNLTDKDKDDDFGFLNVNCPFNEHTQIRPVVLVRFTRGPGLVHMLDSPVVCVH